MERPIPFPLASGRYETGPSMRRFGQAGQGMPAEEGHFQPDDRLAVTLAAKLDVLRRAPGECHLVAPGLTPVDESSLRTALQESFRLLAAEHPAMASVDADGVTLHHLGVRLAGWARCEAVGPGWPELGAVAPEVQAWLSTQDGLGLLGNALGLAVQEDLAIVRGPVGQAEAGSGGAHGSVAGGAPEPPPRPDALEWLHVCLPSSWVPAQKIGLPFASVHEPVAHSQSLLAASGRIVRAMIDAGPFVRYVWGIAPDGDLGHNPRLHHAPPWPAGATPDEVARRAWFRVERQTTHGFPALDRALFTIRYWVAPLGEAAADPWRRERLAAALAGMDGEALSYKGLTPVRDALVAWLRA